MSKIIVVSGVSGSGKTTIMRSIMDNELVSFTSRDRREGEVEGRDYIFISKEMFEELLNSNGLVEYTNYNGNYYGLLQSEIDLKLSRGDAFFVADVVGMRHIKKTFKDVVTIFIYSTKEDCETNMLDRGDSQINISKRLSTYDEEISNLAYYDHVVTNKRGNVEDCIQDVRDIIYDI